MAKVVAAYERKIKPDGVDGTGLEYFFAEADRTFVFSWDKDRAYLSFARVCPDPPGRHVDMLMAYLNGKECEELVAQLRQWLDEHVKRTIDFGPSQR
jgi:hypothetical protein